DEGGRRHLPRRAQGGALWHRRAAGRSLRQYALPEPGAQGVGGVAATPRPASGVRWGRQRRARERARGGAWPLAAAEGVEQARLIRRPRDARDDCKKRAYDLTFAPMGTLLEALVVVAARHWAIAESVGDGYGRGWARSPRGRHVHGWYRHITL